jgi:hypothetical protein
MAAIADFRLPIADRRLLIDIGGVGTPLFQSSIANQPAAAGQ